MVGGRGGGGASKSAVHIKFQQQGLSIVCCAHTLFCVHRKRCVMCHVSCIVTDTELCVKER